MDAVDTRLEGWSCLLKRMSLLRRLEALDRWAQGAVPAAGAWGRRLLPPACRWRPRKRRPGLPRLPLLARRPRCMRYFARRAAQREAANTAAFILAHRYAAMQLGALEAAEEGKPRGAHMQRAVTLDRSATLDWRPLFVAGGPAAAWACWGASEGLWQEAGGWACASMRHLFSNKLAWSSSSLLPADISSIDHAHRDALLADVLHRGGAVLQVWR